jgi:hypothetical protein
MKVSDLFEAVNSKVFRAGFEQEREILNGKYRLIAKAGYLPHTTPPTFVSKQFRIEAKTDRNVEIGWVNFEIRDDKLEAIDLYVNVKHRRKGIASEMYRFARDLGNDIQASTKQTGMGKVFWSKKDHSK